MNKKRLETALPATRNEAMARAINARPWEPLPGVAKRQCRTCRYFFAAPTASNELRCPDCVERPRRVGPGLDAL